MCQSSRSIFRIGDSPLRVPEKISITITADGAPLKGIPAMLSFAMEQKNNHSLIFGPSDESGTIHISGDEIRLEARKTMELFLMDYADIDSYWTGSLRVMPMNRDALKRALSAFRQFRGYEFRVGYEEMLRRANDILSKIPGTRLDSLVHCQAGEPITVENIPAEVSSC
jgi:hypothetical protein